MHFIKYLTAAFVVFTALLYLPQTVLSQNQTPSADSTANYRMDEIIITANRFEESPFSVGRNVTVIGQQEIERSAYSSVGELLASRQSVHMVGIGQTPGSLQTAYIRNANSDNSVVLIDGMRISDPSATDNSLNLAELSLANVQRVEIVRGAHSTLYGSSAIGGVINIITKNKTEPGFSGNVETNHGIYSDDTYATTNSAFLNYTGTGGFYGNAAAYWRDTRGMDATIDTVSDAAFHTTDRDGFEKLDLNGKVGYKTDRWDAFASYRRVDQTNEADQGAFADDDNAFADFQRDLLNYQVRYQLSKVVELTFKGGYSDLDRDFVNDSSRVDAAENFDGAVNETHAVASLLENEVTGQYQNEHFTATAGIGNTRQTMNIETFTFNRAFDFESSTDLDSLNLEENISHVFLHTELGGGLITEAIDNITLGLGARLLDHNRFGMHATYEVNPKVQLSPGALVYGAITTGFNAPSLYQLNTPEQGAGAFTARGNAELRPETSVSYELGWKQRIGSRLQFNAALFKTEVKDVIEYVYLWNSDTPVGELSFQEYLGDTYLNASRQDVRGLEIGLDAQLTRRLSFHGDAGFTDSELSFSPENIDTEQIGGNHVQVFESGEFVSNAAELDGLTRRPAFSGNFRIKYRPSDMFSFTVSSRFVGSRDDIAYSPALGPLGALQFNEVDAYNLTDLGARYEVSQNLAFNIKIENIFDENYREINGYQTKGRGFFVQGQLSF